MPFLPSRVWSFRAKFQLTYDQTRDYAIQAFEIKGLSTNPDVCKYQKGTEHNVIRRKFELPTHKVPSCRLVFQGFDEGLSVSIQGVPWQWRGKPVF